MTRHDGLVSARRPIRSMSWTTSAAGGLAVGWRSPRWWPRVVTRRRRRPDRERRPDVLVVGAGPAGSALAPRRSPGGRDVLLVEAAAHPRPKACAEYASPRIMEELARLGEAAGWPTPPCRCGHEPACRRSQHGDQLRRRPRAAGGLGPRPAQPRRDAGGPRGGGRRGLPRADALVGLVDDGGRVRGAILRDAGTRAKRWSQPGGSSAPMARDRASAGWSGSIAACASRDARPGGARLGHRRPDRTRRDARGPGCYVGLAPTPGGELNVGMALPIDGRRGSARGRFEAAIAGRPSVARRFVGSERLTPIRGAAPIGTASRQQPGRAGCSSAMRPASSTRSPARASTAPCARREPPPTRSWTRR